tara:strand:+ start:215 stop:850 length:636 start_codon:yes stop_codon:yes gene_type:complete
MKKIAKTYPFQVFRHRCYIPCLNFIDYMKDKYRKIDTQKYIELEDLGINKKLGSRYESISYSKLKEIFKFSLDRGFTSFLDIGCGLGRPIIVAGESGFVNLHGVDISTFLIDQCHKHLKSNKLKANLECGDVSAYNLPPGKLCIFLFNPFGEDKIKDLFTKIAERNEETLVLYFNPKHFNIIDGRFKVDDFRWKNFGLYEEKCFVYLFPKI